MNRNYTFICITFLLLGLKVTAQQQPVPLSYGAPRVVNFTALAAAEERQPVIAPRNFEMDDEKQRGIPKNHRVPADATKTIIDLPTSETRTQSPAPTSSFNGLLDNNTAIPPDVQGVAGPNHLMEMLNSQFRIFNKTGGTVSTLNVWTFYGFSSSNFYSDPRITYDPYNDRWISCIMANVPGGHNGIYVAVSQTSDPTGLWNIFNVDATGNNTDIIDYPSLGFNKNWIVVTGNIFNGSSQFTKVKILVFNKSSLYSGSSGTVNTFSDASGIFTLSPARTFDSTLTTEYLLTEWSPNTSGFCYLKQFTITGSVNSPVYTAGSTDGVNQPYSQTAKSAPQSGTSNKITAGDTRVLSCVYRNSFLYATQTVFLPSSTPNRASAQWWKIDPSSGTVNQFGRVDDNTGTNFYTYPSIDVNANDDVVVGYTQLSSSIFASASYSYRTASDASNTLESPYLYKAGLATYFKTFGGSINRWGDYSATCVDPTDGSLWTLQEFASSPANNWGTVWANIPASNAAACATPSGLTATNVTSSSANLSWGSAGGATGYNVRYRPTGNPTWTTTTSATTSVSVSGLTVSTQYEFQVQTSCSGGDTSSFSASANFTTLSNNPCTETFEPNNTKNTAAAISVGVDISSQISTSGDIDWYKFNNTSGASNIKVTLTTLPANYNEALFNSSNTQVAISKKPGTQDESMIFNTSVIGTYKIKVNGAVGAFSNTQCYTLHVFTSSTPFKLGDGSPFVSSENTLKVYPNPNAGVMTLEYNSNADATIQVRVFDMTGKIFVEEQEQISEGTNMLHPDLNKLMNGVYFVEISNGTEISRSKFVIEK